jgi:UDP-N-acetylglucosamine 2-epimerase (non-hydrolysing)
LNPNVKSIVHQKLGSLPNVQLTAPLGYLEFITQMNRASVIITDSGGVQEEAPYLKKPIFVLRESTERPEGVKAGVAELVGSDTNLIIEKVTRVLTDSEYRRKFESAVSPYGDGHAAQRIFDAL